MSSEKYYSTTINGIYIPDEFLTKYSATNRHKQFLVVCKAKSRAAAERHMRDLLNITWQVFRPNYTSETGQKSALEAADKFTAVIALDTMGNDFYDMKHIIDEVSEFKRN